MVQVIIRKNNYGLDIKNSFGSIFSTCTIIITGYTIITIFILKP